MTASFSANQAHPSAREPRNKPFVVIRIREPRAQTVDLRHSDTSGSPIASPRCGSTRRSIDVATIGRRRLQRKGSGGNSGRRADRPESRTLYDQGRRTWVRATATTRYGWMSVAPRTAYRPGFARPTSRLVRRTAMAGSTALHLVPAAALIQQQIAVEGSSTICRRQSPALGLEASGGF
jgi:hypothetical protein